MQLEEAIDVKLAGPSTIRLCWGDLFPITKKRIQFLDTPRSGATLVFVKTKADVRSHDLDPNPHFSECNTWIGADGAPILYQQGDWRALKKRQLFRLHEDESILFIDALKEVTKLTAGPCGTKPKRLRATEGEVADYVLGEAKKRGENPNTRTWCFHALQELGCQAQLDSFHSMFPDFHRK